MCKGRPLSSQYHAGMLCLQFPTVVGVSVGKSSTGGPSKDPFLLACRFFDRECAGYIEADDLEEIAFMVSDGISSKLPLLVLARVLVYCLVQPVCCSVHYCTANEMGATALFVTSRHSWCSMTWLKQDCVHCLSMNVS